MPKYIPIKSAKQFCKEQDCRQVIIAAWDGKLTHVVTYGKTKEDFSQAAEGGNFVKKALGWPDNMCNAKPSRINNIEKENARLRAKVKELEKLADA